MRFDDFSFGSIRIDGMTHEHDVVIDRGEISKRKKKPAKKFRDSFGHTPLSMEEEIPWKCQRLVVGTGAYGGLPVMKEVKTEAKRRKIELLILPTTQGYRDTEARSRGDQRDPARDVLKVVQTQLPLDRVPVRPLR